MWAACNISPSLSLSCLYNPVDNLFKLFIVETELLDHQSYNKIQPLGSMNVCVVDRTTDPLTLPSLVICSIFYLWYWSQLHFSLFTCEHECRIYYSTGVLGMNIKLIFILTGWLIESDKDRSAGKNRLTGATSSNETGEDEISGVYYMERADGAHAAATWQGLCMDVYLFVTGIFKWFLPPWRR